ncbi:putative transporter YwbF [Lentibacillus sp. JNUCC-1]|uniref:MFS transporter n=1 Tax=Lentibacillus sp. JNUCC-1 TaxID=2654513 RepID=UPI0013282777|nr:putative transporter YwbF [Lentibacillus sp. JNUCC-1]
MSKQDSLTPLKMLLFSFHATNTIIISFLPLYLKAKGLNPTEIGWVLAVGPLASIFSQPFWGYMSDKYKTVKRMLLICVVGLIFSSIVFFQMNGLLAILIMGAVFYFFTSPIGGWVIAWPSAGHMISVCHLEPFARGDRSDLPHLL